LVNLSAFEQLCSLEIIELSLDSISGLGHLARRLASITLEKCKFTNGIHDFFVGSAVPRTEKPENDDDEDDDGVEEAVEWPELREANIVRSDLTSLDSSLTLAPRLKILDASYNCLTDRGVESLTRFGQLTRVNLSFNKLRCVPLFGPGSGVYLHTLLLRNNSLDALTGLEALVSLKVILVNDAFYESAILFKWPRCEFPSLEGSE
jgi:Leucine-rich repeat (LRR) protein